jgi:hypothetical protein
MSRVCRFHAKNPSQPFVADTDAKNRSVPDGMRQFAGQWLDGIYRQLEARRVESRNTVKE